MKAYRLATQEGYMFQSESKDGGEKNHVQLKEVQQEEPPTYLTEGQPFILFRPLTNLMGTPT